MKTHHALLGARPIAVLLALLATLTVAPSAFGATGNAIDWNRCSDGFLREAHARCALLEVPLAYNHPTGRTIQLAVARIAHTSSPDKYQGVILTNPGGPGYSGLSKVTMGQNLPAYVAARYDWIGFDPRGVGASIPALTCKPNYWHANRPAYTPNSDTDIAVWLSRARAYAEACESKNSKLLPFMTTADSARDMESIRIALGVDQISYWGEAYGTYLGQVYASLFPTHVRRMVFDSSVDPRAVWYRNTLTVDQRVEHTLNLWFRWIAEHSDTYHLGHDWHQVRETFYTAQAALDGNPAGGVVGPSEWADTFYIVPSFRNYVWPDAATLFANWVHLQDADSLVGWYLGTDVPGDDNWYAANLAVRCTDAPWPTNWSTWKSDAQAIADAAPFATWGNVWMDAPCLYWSAPIHQPIEVGGNTRILLVTETQDAVAPYRGSLEVRSRFPQSRLIAVNGSTLR